MDKPAPRLFFIDALRIIAFALLVPYHVGMYYVSWGWHVKSPQLLPQLEPLLMATSPWRMSLLFVLSGTALGLMLAARGGGQPWLARRWQRLGWPLLAGMLLVVPPQSYLEVRDKLGYDGSYVAFMRLYLSAYQGFCVDGCLVLPTWNHLWFLAYLLGYTTLLALVLRRWPQAPQRLAAVLQLRCQALRLPPPAQAGLWFMLPVALLLLTRLALGVRFPTTHALVDDWYAHSQYLALFAFGLLAAHWPQLWPRWAAMRWPALVLALLAWLLIVGLEPRGIVRMLLASTQQWCAIVAACGLAWRHLNRPWRWSPLLTEAMLPLYLLHQTVIIVAAVAMRPLALPPLAEAPLLVGLAFGVSGAVFAAARRVGWLRPLLGLAPKPLAAARRSVSESA